MPGFNTDGAIATDPGSIFDYGASTGEAFGAGFERSLDTNPIAIIGRQARFLGEDLQSIAGNSERVDQEAAQKEVAGRGLDLKIPAGGMTRVELDMLQYLKQREGAQATVAARSSGLSGSVAGFAGGLVGSVADPVNVASAFIPIVGEARYAQWLAQAGKGAFARAAVRAGAGALEGAAGAAIVEPIVYTGAQQEQRDYGLFDSFLNVTMGGALGGGLHILGGAVHDRIAGTPRLRDFAAVAPEDVKRSAMQDAVAALERGDAVDVDHVFMKEAGDRYGVTDQEFLGRAMEFDDNELKLARDTVVMARGGEDQAGPWSLTSIIRAMGGIKVRDAAGNITREGAEVLAALGDKRPPGLINNKAGKTADYVREALAQDGWFKSTDASVVDLQDFYDLLEAEHRGDRPTRIGETRGEKLRTNAAEEAARAGVTKDDTVRQAAVKVAEMRARELRERADIETGDPDFEPSEIIYREPGEENPLAEPVTEETLSRYEPIDPNAAAKPKTGARGLSDLIPQARAERTEDAFARQFVEEADQAIAAEKAKPKDKIEAVKADEDVFKDVVDQYRDQGHLTPEDEKALKQGDELATWAERRAKAFEAAAGCIEAA